MTRVLQIRRGNTDRNNKFTGLAGEVSFDTQAKTLRIHDGETLGGHTLARLDQVTGGVPGQGNSKEFDINTVDEAFWKELFEKFLEHPVVETLETKELTIANVGYIETIIIAEKKAKLIQAVLVAKTPEAGYAIDDIVATFGIGTRNEPVPLSFTDTYGQHIRLMVAKEAFWVNHKDTGIKTEITNTRWKVKFIAWF